MLDNLNRPIGHGSYTQMKREQRITVLVGYVKARPKNAISELESLTDIPGGRLTEDEIIDILKRAGNYYPTLKLRLKPWVGVGYLAIGGNHKAIGDTAQEAADEFYNNFNKSPDLIITVSEYQAAIRLAETCRRR